MATASLNSRSPNPGRPKGSALDTAWIVALASGIAAAVGALIGPITRLILARAGIRKGDQAALVLDYQGLVDRRDREVDRLAAEMRQVQKERTDCLVAQEALKGDIKILQSAVRRLQGLTGDDAPAQVTPAVVVADLTGKIKHASSTTPLLHYLPAELVGKNVECLIAERYRADHAKGLAALARSETPPWTERTIQGHALTKDGQEVAVSVALSAWRDGEQWRVAAEITRRSEPPTPTEAAKIHRE